MGLDLKVNFKISAIIVNDPGCCWTM